MSPGSTKSARASHFVVFSDDWGIHPSSCQHIFGHILKDHSATWCNTIGMRPPRFTLTDLQKIYQKVSRMLLGRRQGAAHRPDNLTVVQPIMLPYMSNRLVRAFNRWSVARSLRRARDADAGRADKTIVLTTVPNAADYVDLIPADLIVYYCVDDFSEWPGLDKELILGLERELLEKVDLILATSPALQSRLARTGKPVEMLEHGVDVDHFSQTAAAEHTVLQEIRKPRVGFFGLIDGRMDQETLMFLAEILPSINFVLAGPSEVSTAAMERFANIHCVGRLPYAELPAFIQGIDALIIPYKVDALANALSPLKLKEYLATGKPVVSSAIPASLAYRQYVEIADSQTDWSGLVKTAVVNNSPGRENSIAEVLKGDSWSEKAGRLVELCLS